MFERFTREARTAVRLAVTAAEQAQSPTVDVEHLLTALVRGPFPASSGALAVAGLTSERLPGFLDEIALFRRRGGLGPADAEALRSIGIDLDAVVEGIERTHGPRALTPPPRRRTPRVVRRLMRGGRAPAPGTASTRRRHRPFTPAAKQVLELSLRQALELGDREIRDTHLLLGVLAGNDPVSQALAARGITLPAVRPELRRPA